MGMSNERLSVVNRKEKREAIKSEIISTGEALDMLGFSRVRLHQIVKRGNLEPVGYGVYLKDDIIAFKKAFNEARSNNEWSDDFI